MSNKNTNRRSAAAKKIVQTNGSTNSNQNHLSLSDHIDLIRKDVLKLREDLVDGYEFLKSTVEKKDWRSFLG